MCTTLVKVSSLLVYKCNNRHRSVNIKPYIIGTIHVVLALESTFQQVI